ncbi:hypothetical protein BGI41_04005 [Methanobrevibacter sp. 87.7]|uniref:hypothetical protein n=1 Tax=Methanobrevibacter sp. 87.7 TaxID=387957 RepID=UPI000B4FF140|nr:hypothetical protein [Methanobrevibacter sp. 87.7]OWT33141.1 hypothetical protein BGI41_04005 [Methanobrevibacter sp. 87.7]
MEILLISEYILIIALLFMMLVALRVSAKKSILSTLIGTSAVTLTMGVLLILIGEVFSIGFCRDIALAIIFLGVVGTIGYAIVARRT